MMNLLTGSSQRNSFVANQALSSAQMVRQMVLDEIRRGDFSNLQARVVRIEELVQQGFLRREDERRLTLLEAQFLEAAGETKRAFRLVGQLLADEDTLGEELFVDLRRFRTRLLLNIWKVNEARAEVDRIERVVLTTDASFGVSVDAVDDDNSRVTVPTWLLTAEVCLAEGKSAEAMVALRSTFECMKQRGQSAEEGVQFELLSALACYLSCDDAGAPALAYLYRVHVVLESGMDASLRARIAAAAGDTEKTAGLSKAEVTRWRSYGPDKALVARYLSEGEAVVPPSDLLMKVLPPQVISVDSLTEVTRVADRAPLTRLSASRVDDVPMSFQFDAFGLEEISSMFDFNMKTGPLVVDWSACDKEIIEQAIAAEAICAEARQYDRGTIYINNGSYVDARFDGASNGNSAAHVLDTIFELFRISMAGLPGACGYQSASGPLAARVPEILNLRPNNVNIDLMKRLDHMRSGVVENEDESIDLLFDAWQEPVKQVTEAVEQTLVTVGVADVAIVPEGSFVSTLCRIMEAVEVEQIRSLACDALTVLGFQQPRVDYFVAGAKGSLVETIGDDDLFRVIDECSSGVVTARFLLSEPVTINCPDAVRAILNASAQRLRTVSGREFKGRIETTDFIAADPITQALLSTLRDLAVLDGVSERQKVKHICLVGERGVGKEILARLIHNWSGRAGKPFGVAHFGFISKELAPAEIFGSRKGAFTGAEKDRDGYIQEAQGGTLFLDELDEASGAVQALLKRVVQFQTFNRVGDPKELKADIRFVAATNVVEMESLAIKRDLKDRFLLLRVPPLRERRGDIRPLAESFAAEYECRLPEPVLVFLEKLDWPGNVRQLQNVIERSCALAGEASDLTLDLVQQSAAEDGAVVTSAPATGLDFIPLRNGESLETRLDEVEKRHVTHALEFCKGNRTHSAGLLGISRQSMIRLAKKFDL